MGFAWRSVLWAGSLFCASAFCFASVPPISGVDLVKGASVSVSPGEERKGTVVVFLSAKCPCSSSHEPVLSELSREFPEFRFVGVNSNADEEEPLAREHFRSASLPFPVIRDSGSTLANRFGALKTPHAFVLDPRGEILFQGGVDDSSHPATSKRAFLRDALMSLRVGKSPEVRLARALGCVIKR